MYVVWVLFVMLKMGGIIEWQALSRMQELAENLARGYRIWCDVSTTVLRGRGILCMGN